MDDEELKELENPDTWADDAGEIRMPVKSPRAVVSVAFSREDFQRVTEQARRLGMKTSEFIRKAALDQIQSTEPAAVISSVSGVPNEYPVSRSRGARVSFSVREDSPPDNWTSS